MTNPVPQVITLILLFIHRVAIAAPIEQPAAITHQEIIRVITGLFLVLLVIACLAWVTKRLRLVNLTSSGGFQTIATMTLGPKEKVVLLKISERYLLLGVGSGAVNLLYDFGTLLPEGFNPHNKLAFAEILKSVVRKS